MSKSRKKRRINHRGSVPVSSEGIHRMFYLLTPSRSAATEIACAETAGGGSSPFLGDAAKGFDYPAYGELRQALDCAQSCHRELEGGDDSLVHGLLLFKSSLPPPPFGFCSISKWLRVNSYRRSRQAGMPWAVGPWSVCII